MLNDKEIVGLKKIRSRKLYLTILIAIWAGIIFLSAILEDYQGLLFVISIVFFFILISYSAFVSLSTCPRCSSNFGSAAELFSTKCKNCGLELSELDDP